MHGAPLASHSAACYDMFYWLLRVPVEISMIIHDPGAVCSLLATLHVRNTAAAALAICLLGVGSVALQARMELITASL
jgi:hypothetical protein